VCERKTLRTFSAGRETTNSLAKTFEMKKCVVSGEFAVPMNSEMCSPGCKDSEKSSLRVKKIVFAYWSIFSL